jgi:hypothetical protein
MNWRPYWLDIEWWRYVLQPVDTGGEGLKFMLKAYVCRWKGHPHGVVFYNPEGLEPDMTCKNCGDDLG